MESYSLLPADSYIVYNKTILNDFDKKILISFYEPIIGHLAISIYLTLWNDLETEQISRAFTHHHLMSILKCPLNTIKEARTALEAVGLLKAYVKEGSINSYVYEMYSPLTPAEFFNHPILNVVLYNNIGESEYQHLKRNYQKEKLDLREYKEITKAMDEVYASSCDIPVFAALDRQTADITCVDQVDFDFIAASIPKGIMNERALNKKTKELINELAYIYKLDSLKMMELIRSVLNEYGMIDKNGLRLEARKQYTFDRGALPTLVYRSQPEYLKSPVGDASLRGKIIAMFDGINPVDFLRAKNKVSKITAGEMKIIEELVTEFKLPPAVINVLLDYCLRKNNNRLTKSYVEAVASQWKRAGLKTATEAMDFAEKEHKRLEKKTKEVVKKSKDPVWFNKKIESTEISDEDAKELENLLKEFK